MPELIDIGTRRELFVDDFLIDEMRGVDLRLQHPERHEIAFSLGQPWESNIGCFMSVVQEGDSIRLYYRASQSNFVPGFQKLYPGVQPDPGDQDDIVIALAESTNGGRSFSRPNLGLEEFQGSKQNNIIFVGKRTLPPVFLDANPNAPSEERYKGLCNEWARLYAMCSADGIRWRLMQEEPLKMSGAFDTFNTAFWDSIAGCYRSFTRYIENLTPESTREDILGSELKVIRCIQSSTSPDFIHWTEPVPNQYRDGIRDMQLYTIATLPCPGAEHIFLSFPMRYQQDRIKKPDHPWPGLCDGVFMASRDGVLWTRYREAWVRPGLDPRNWTERSNRPTWGIVEASPTEWSMFISEHYRQPDVKPRLRRLSIRPHGFVSVHADYDGGECITEPVTYAGRELRLNCATSAVGSIQVEIQDEHGLPIEGFTLADTEPFYGDEVDVPIRWKGEADLPGGRPVRFRFVLKDADLFAFRTIK